MPSGVYERTNWHLERLRQRNLKGSNNPMYGRSTAGSLNGRWAGDNLTYSGVHQWLKNIHGKATKCEHCGGTVKVQWANKFHKSRNERFRRNIEDWLQLCVWCHKKYDNHVGPMKNWGFKNNNEGA